MFWNKIGKKPPNYVRYPKDELGSEDDFKDFFKVFSSLIEFIATSQPDEKFF